MAKKKIDINLLIAVGVLVASFAALFVSVRQAHIMNQQTDILLEQTKASAWPSVSIGMDRSIVNGDVNKYLFTLTNRGTGPAIVEQTIITYDDTPISNWDEFYELINVPNGMNIGHGNDILIGRVIPPNEEFGLINWNGNPEIMNFVYQLGHKINIEVCYKSVYGEYWTVKRNGLQTNLEKNEVTQSKACRKTNLKLFVE